MGRRSPVAILLLFSFLAVAPATVAQKRHVDSKYGYSVKTVRKWEGVPVKSTEKNTVLKWTSPRAERRFRGEMQVHIFDRSQDDEATTRQAAFPFGRSVRSYQTWARFYRRGLDLGEPTAFKVAAPKGVEVRANLYQTTVGGKGRERWYVILVASTPEREYAMELTCGLVNKRKYRPLFMKSVKSFRLIDVTAGRKNPGEVTAELTPREKARQRARKDARIAGWWYLESKNYFIVTNVEKKKRGRILDLRRRLEAMRRLYLRDFPPAAPIEAVSIVRVCKDGNSYSAYGGPPGSAGYWHAIAEELVLYMRGEKSFAYVVLNHEGFHQYIHYAARCRPHTWYNEGHADYYGGFEVVGNRPVKKKLKWRIGTIKKHIAVGTHVPMKKFLYYSKRQYYSDMSRCYAQGWSVVYFLTDGLAPGHPWRRIIPTYYKVLLQTGDQRKAQAKALQQVDIAELEARWKLFITKGKKAPAP